MRSHLTSLVFEKLLDNIPDTDKDVYNLAQSIISPTVKVVEAACSTTVGELETVGFRIEGEKELSTNSIISRARIEYLLSQGIYSVSTIHLLSCTSKGGICARCFSADFQDQPVPTVGSTVNVPSKIVAHIEIIEGIAGKNDYLVETDPTAYTAVHVYCAGQLKDPSTYTISNGVITVTFPIIEGDHIVLRFIDLTTTPYMGYLSNTYSGSLLGMKPLVALPTILKPSLLSSLIPEARLELISSKVKTLDIPTDQLDYIDNIVNPLEKLLYITALYVIYSGAHG